MDCLFDGVGWDQRPGGRVKIEILDKRVYCGCEIYMKLIGIIRNG